MSRPEAHRIGDVGEVIVEKAFLQAGWVMNRLNRDYGFDFMAQYVRLRRPTWAYAFIQVKALGDRLKANKAGEIPFTVDTDYLANWASCQVPAFLAVCEIPSERVFLASCHEVALAIQKRYGEHWRAAKTRTVYLHASSELSPRLFRRVAKEVQKFWKPLRPSRLESMALLSNVSCLPMAQAMAPWIILYHRRRDRLIAALDQALGSNSSQHLRDAMMLSLEQLDENMKWSFFGQPSLD
jgi:hypothetical protein